MERLRRHIDSSKQREQLLGTAPGVPSTLEGRQMLPNFLERYPVAPVIGTGRTERNVAIGNNFADNSCDLPDPVIMFGVSHIKHLVGYRFERCVEQGNDGLANIEPMSDRAPRSAVTGHFDFLRGPSQSGEIV